MSNYGKDEEQYILQSMDAMNKVMTPFAVSLAEISFFGVALGRYFAVSLFPIAAIIFLYFAYGAELHSYWNLLFLELSSGFFFFAAAPTVVHFGRIYRWQVPVLGVLIAGPLLYLAYDCKKLLPNMSYHFCEFLQAALIEYSIALLLMVGLEIAMAPWLNKLAEKYRDTLNDLKQLKAGRNDLSN